MDIESYYNMLSAAPSSEISYLLIRSFCWKPSEGWRIKAEGSKDKGSFSGRLYRKVGRSVVLESLSWASFPSTEEYWGKQHVTVPVTHSSSHAPLSVIVLTWFFSIVIFCLKFYITYCKKELLKWPLADDGSTSSAFCKVCEGIQLSQITMPKCAFSKVVSDCSECETGRQSEVFPTEWGIVELALCSELSWTTMRLTKQDGTGASSPS